MHFENGTEEFLSRSFSKEDWQALKQASISITSRYQTIKTLAFAEKNATGLAVTLGAISRDQKMPIKSIISALQALIKEAPPKEPTINEIVSRATFGAKKRKLNRNPEQSCYGCDDTGLINGCVNKETGNVYSFRCPFCQLGTEMSSQIPLWNDNLHAETFSLRLHREKAPSQEPNF